MRKNLMMRLSAFLLVAVLLTTCVISGTFAKYTTTNEAEDEARVAQWGVTVTAPSAMFATTYNSNAVKSSNSEKLVAPGTTGTLAAFTITGTPEVKVDVVYTASLELAGWVLSDDDNAEEYCPIKFTVGGTAYYIGATINEELIENVADLETAVENAIVAANSTYAVGASLAQTLTVSWEWAFSTNAANDVKDTELTNNTNLPTISLEVTCTVNQAA